MLNEEKKKKIEEIFKERINNITEEDIKEAIKRGKEKIDNLADKLPDKLKEVWEDIKDMWNMLVDYYKGIYKEVPWGTIAAIVVALLYFALPIDIIPDIIPGIGYIDDVYIISLTLKFIHDDLKDYRKWKKENKAIPL